MKNEHDFVNRQMKLLGANCPSCIYTIEKFGRKMDGVKDIKVDAASGMIDLVCRDDISILEGIKNLVNKIGYDAVITGNQTL